MLEQNLRILMNQKRTKDLVRVLPWAVRTMNPQESSSTGYNLTGSLKPFFWGLQEPRR